MAHEVAVTCVPSSRAAARPTEMENTKSIREVELHSPNVEAADAPLMPRIDAVLTTKVNLADYQNAVPVLRELSVLNSATTPLRNLDLTVQSTPAFIKPKTWRIDTLTPGQPLQLRDLDVQLDGALLSRLTEAEPATLSFVLRSQNDSTELARVEKAIELLPRNQWGGLSHLPDLIAAFVQPNDQAIERLLKNAADILRKNGKSAALNGYEGGARRAWELTSAIWSSVGAMGLDYALPPASFERTGQKVRGATQVCESGLATCLDLALLFCSALEQAGLNPLVVFTNGHAFAGVWLKPEEFSTTVVDDVTALRKRVKLKELLLFETTVVTQRPPAPFSRAAELGAQQISEEKGGDFELAVDVRRARLQRIKPLSSAEATPPLELTAAPIALEPALEEAPELPEEGSISEPDPATLNPQDRLARWQRKLLDLSLRNNLLNFRNPKKSLKLEAPDPGALEDLLSDGHAIKLLPRPDLMDGADPRSQRIYESREQEDVRRGHALDALKRREVFASVPAEELESRLVDLYRTARTTLQEGGANTLFLALGFLCWTREDKADQRYRAPLILIPVSLNRKSVRSGFTLTLHEDEPRFNPTLIEMLRQDFNLRLGIADGELPKDEAGLDVSAIWKSVSYAIKDIKGWEVSEDVVLASFSFAKYLMWKDLVERTDQLRQNPVVRHLIDSPRDTYPPGPPFPNPRRLDDEYQPDRVFCPLPADSSQLSAVLAAASGKDFVLIGPPGTGKSQTIANLIAQCLGDGKRVLFVSEKIAALDVVYRRLREVKLGDFCLELHSNKARKVEVLAQLQRAWDARGSADPDSWRAEAHRLKRLRDQLNGYVERLHARHSNGLTLYTAIGSVVSGEEMPEVRLFWSTADAHDVAAMEAMRDICDRLEVNAKALGSTKLSEHALSLIGHTDWSPTWQQAAVESVSRVCDAAEAASQALDRFLRLLRLPLEQLNRQQRAACAVLARVLPSAAGHSWSFVLRSDSNAIVEGLQRGKALLDEHRVLSAQLSEPWSDQTVAACDLALERLQRWHEIRSKVAQPWSSDICQELNSGITMLKRIDELGQQLSVRYGPDVDKLNLIQMQHDWTKATQSFWPVSWLGKRKVLAALTAVVADGGEPDIARDLPLLLEIRGLKSKVSALEIGPAVEGVWAGLRTRPEFALSALRFQAALAAARRNQPWDDDGFEPIANGRCGERLMQELARLRTLATLEAEISQWKELEHATGGVWRGVATSSEALRAALLFQEDRRRLREAGALSAGHERIARGDCGTVLANDLRVLRVRAEVEEKIKTLDSLRDLTSGVWNGVWTAREGLDAALKFHALISPPVANLAADREQLALVRDALGRLLAESALLEHGAAITTAGNAYLKAWGALSAALDQFSGVARVSPASKGALEELPLDQMVARCRSVVLNESRLKAWCAWRKVYEEAAASGLEPLVHALDSGVIAPDTVRRAFETNYCRWWLRAAVDNDEVIKSFVSPEHEKRIRDFRALDDRFTELTRDWVRAGLCAELPRQDAVTRNSEWGVLRHEMSKKKRHMPLRELISQLPTALTKLTPCLLMSPLSIAQYLAADTASFDLVVFDEASQIPVWDAIGAIARGKQVVMVGDPKQLPPTSFFDRAESDLDDEDVEGDLESILDECIGANLPTMNLAWHYRSRHESLIAFSNHRYYQGGLVTFPSPVTDDRAVSFHFVQGTYEKGGARINKSEAKALVADLVRRLKSPGFRESKMTIGVVTFNSEQQRLIEDLLDEERRKDPALEPHFADAELEPVFVKNLESVQGDERDIMYFSVTYGPDSSGVVSMNFGPMNREGGERRLNVAITRARQELRVFSTLRAEQIDLSKTRSVGVRDLKHFLEFAERGSRALAEVNSGSLGEYESPFEEAVAVALAKRGWEVHTQVGVSTFRVDLAVVDPHAKGRYLAGIECDGATYHRSATARDRDKLREQVLRRLGWEILRIWSTD
jgi:very-short-patch-repair endonuclease